jgi:hypothetical protein
MNDRQFICITKLEKRKMLGVGYPVAMIISGIFFLNFFVIFQPKKLEFFLP